MIKNLDIKGLKEVHMIGIGGIGMSALAFILLDHKVSITGSDLKENNLIGKLRGMGCAINIGHGALIGNPEIVVRSFSVKDDNPEVIEAKRRRIPVIERSELLRAVIMSKTRAVSVSGTHGKTTTTAMISYLMDKAGLDPTVLIGGEVDHFNGNSRSGKSDIFVTETDESDGYISKLSAKYIVVTNIEKDHMEHYVNMDNLISAFSEYLSRGHKDGALFYYSGDTLLKTMINYFPGKRVSFGFSGQSDIFADEVDETGFSTKFTVHYKGKRLGKAVLNVPGRHNVLNALAAFAVLLEFGVSFKKITMIMKGFKSAKRRFEIQSNKNNIMLVEDYAHHPTEIRAVISMARVLKPKRIVAVFQPHRYSRTQYLENEFETAFQGVDKLVLTDIYSANEEPIEGVGLENISEGARTSGVKEVEIINKRMIPEHLGKTVEAGDIVLVMGAGDINQIIPSLQEIFNRK